jgi:HlyD family secretion protein
VPIASVTTRLPKKADTNCPPGMTNSVVSAPTNAPATNAAELSRAEKKSKDAPKPVEVVFLLEGDHVKAAPVKIGISDDSYWEVTEGLAEGQEIVSGGYRAISRDLEDGKRVRKGPATGERAKLEDKKPE